MSRESLYKFIMKHTSEGLIRKDIGIELLKRIKHQQTPIPNSEDIAIVGIGVNLPGAETPDEFWEVLKNGEDRISDFPMSRRRNTDPYLRYIQKKEEEIRYVKGAYLEEIDRFDSPFFGYSPREAALMDPAHKLFLQTAWRCMEDAGYAPDSLRGSAMGIFLGYASTLKDNYQVMIKDAAFDSLPFSIVATLPAMIPTRLSYMLDLKGPALTLDTACSSALVAVHTACQAMKNKECTLALAGGIKIHTLPVDWEYTKLGIESKDGRTKAFSHHSDGTGIGEGVAIVMLKRLTEAIRDQNHIYAVIKGSALNQDGKTNGITAPNPSSQTDVMLKAWKNAAIEPETITYIQAHGTGTALGDPIEIKGITDAFSKVTDKRQFCALGSVKTNIGHLYEGAGAAGLIAAVLSLKHRMIPPSLHFESPNRDIPFEDSPIYINDSLNQWEGNAPRRCGVNAFGYSGTNCHMVLEEYRDKPLEPHLGEEYLFTISAKSEESLKAMICAYGKWLSTHPSFPLREVSYTMNLGRGHYQYRIAFSAKSEAQFADAIHQLMRKGLESKLKGVSYGGVNRQPQSDPVACSLVESYVEKPDKSILERICQRYVLGEPIPWHRLYPEKTGRISIPGYIFSKYPSWINIPEPFQDQMFHELIWQEKQKDSNAKQEIGKCLVLCGRSMVSKDLIAALKENGEDPLVINTDGGFGEDRYVEICDAIEKNQLEKILHLPCMDLSISARDEKELVSNLNAGILDLLRLVKAVLHHMPEKKLCFYIVLNQTDTLQPEEPRELIPENAAVAGFVGGIQRELPGYQFKCIDFSGREIRPLVDEIRDEEDWGQVLLKNNKRYRPCLTERKPVATSKGQGIREKGTYLITGGTGGIGLQVAKTFAQKHPVNLILLSRSGLPEPLKNGAESDINEPVAEAVEVVRSLREKGSNVDVYRADVTDEKKLAEILRKVREKYGPIHGIVHAAGLGEEQLLPELTEKEFFRIANVKMVGTLLLDRYTAKEPLDFFILFSSIASIYYAPGQASYAAANAFLNAYAKSRKGNGKTMAIQWAAWKDIGMAARGGSVVDTIFKAIAPEEGMKVFQTLVHNPVPSVIVGKLNYGSRIIQHIRQYPILLSEGINTATETGKTRYGEKHPAKKQSTDISAIKENIIRLCCQELGYDDLDEDKGFFELGADSILIVRVLEKLNEEYDHCIETADIFEYPTVDSLAAFIHSKQASDGEEKELNKMPKKGEEPRACSGDIAIIGMAFRFPGADDPDELWAMIKNGVSCIRQYPESRRKDSEAYLSAKGIHKDIRFKNGAYLDHIDLFDYEFFDMTPRDAALIEPGQRMLMEVIWNALEDAGYSSRVKGTDTGIFIGHGASAIDPYARFIEHSGFHASSLAVTGNLSSMMTGRIAYILDTKGPCLLMDTACSSSLTALDAACRSLTDGRCSMAIVGGVRIDLNPLIREIKLGYEVEDGVARPFDNRTQGFGEGEGIGIVILKPLDKAMDSDAIHAVIKASTVSHGGTTMGLTVPNPAAQEDTIAGTWERAHIDPATVSYIETHGTGTKIGDPIELKGITNAFQRFTPKRQFCAVSSSKGMVGHLYEASGIFSLIKAVLAIQHRKIPACVNFNVPNQGIPFHKSAVYVNTKTREWQGAYPKRCGISAFGINGSNSHILLEEPPVRADNRAIDERYLLPLSAKSESSLIGLIKEYIDFFKEAEDDALAAICYSASYGRKHFPIRVALLFHNRAEAIEQLEQVYQKRTDGKPITKKGVWDAESMRGIRKLPNDKELDDFCRNHKKKDASYEAIAGYYIAGLDIPWGHMYAGRGLAIKRIPVYPFDRKRCWIEMKAVEKGESTGTKNQYMQIQWEKSEKEAAVDQDSLKGRKVLIITEGGNSEQNKLRSFFEKMFGQVISAICTEQETLEINGRIMDSEQAYEKILDGGCLHDVNHIIHIAAYRTDASCEKLDPIRVKKYLAYGSLTETIKAFGKMKSSQEIFVTAIAANGYRISGEEKTYHPESALLFGLMRIIPFEYPNIRCFSMDIDSQTSLDACANFFWQPGAVWQVGYRDGIRYLPGLRDLDLRKNDKNRMTYQEQGVYIITGGNGGIGTEVAGMIARKGKVKMVIISRSKIPPRDEWEDYRAKHQDKTARFIEKMMKVEAMGAQVITARCDVSDMDGMRQILSEVRKQHGPVKGIFHCAGTLGHEMICSQSKETAEKVLRPKVNGTLVLDKLTENDRLDFFVLFSSFAAVVGEPGQADYSAANAFMDTYALYRSEVLGKRTVSINWSPWGETGMWWDLFGKRECALKLLSTQMALTALEEIMHANTSRVIVGEINKGFKRVDAFLHSGMYRVEQQEPEHRGVHFHKNWIEDVKVIVNGKNSYSETEKRIAKVWGYVFGYTELNIHDNFFELGGDSIKALETVNLINSEFKTSINLSFLMGHPTICEMAEEIERQKDNRPHSSLYREIKSVEEKKEYPLSSAQKRIYINYRLYPDSTLYNITRVFKIVGELDIQKLQASIGVLIEKHESMRTCFYASRGEPVQIVKEPFPYHLETKMVSKEALEREIRESVRPYDLRQLPLFTIKVYEISGSNERYLLLDKHHIITDGASMDILVGQLAVLYQGMDMANPIYQYKDYACWQDTVQKQTEGIEFGVLDKQKQYWLTQLKNAVFDSYLPMADPNKTRRGFSGSQFVFKLDGDLYNGLKGIMQETSTTWHMLLISAYIALLFRYSGKEDICIGTPVIGREHPSLSEIIGMFVNTLIIRSHPKADISFRTFMHSVKATCLEAYANQDYQFDRLTDDLKMKRQGYGSIPGTMFSMQNVGVKKIPIDTLTMERMEFDSRISKFDLYLEAIQQEDSILLRFEFATDLYEVDTIRALSGHYLDVLKAVEKDPNIKLGADLFGYGQWEGAEMEDVKFSF